MKKFLNLAFILCFLSIAGGLDAYGYVYAAPRALEVYADSFPKPVGQRNMLFYIQRTPNINTIIYALNVDDKNKLDDENPIHVYWIRYGEKGQTEELSYIQRRYAYGLKTKKLSADAYELRFVSYKDLPFYLRKSAKDNQFHVYATINKKEMILHRIYLQIEGGSFWFPSVKWVDVEGFDPVTGRAMTERFKP